MRTAMTSADGVLTPGSEPTVEPVTEPTAEPAGERVTRRRRIWPRLLAGFVLGFLLCIGLAAGALYAYDNDHDGRVLYGVTVGGVDLSGLDYTQASAKLADAFAAYGEGQVVVHTVAGDVTVPYAAFSRRADVGAMVDEAMQAGRSGTTFERAVAEVRLALSGTSIEPRVTLDSVALAAKVDEGVAAFDRAPVDSRVVKSLASVYTMPAQDGRSFDGTAAANAALAALARIDAPPEVAVEAAATPVAPEHGDQVAVAAKSAADRMVGDVVVTLGKKHWKIKAATVRTWLRFETAADGSSVPTVDLDAIPKALGKVAKAVKVAPVSAKYLKSRSGHIVGVAPAKDGRQLDGTATAVAIAQAVTDRGAGAPSTPVKAQTSKIEPKLTTAEATKRGPLMKMLGTWKTWFPISDHNFFGANIWQPARIIDGTVLRPGQRFEWWSAVGPVSPSRGFGPGGFIAGDHTEPTGALGGGMCSSSTTLFNAALRAGLQMGARSNHKYYIYRYPLGLDATVSKTPGGGSQTMSFTNDMKTPIVIRTYRYRAGGKGWVRYEIWGIPDGRKVSLSRPSVSNVRKAVTRTEYTSSPAARHPPADRVPRERDARLGQPRRPRPQRARHPPRRLEYQLRALERRHPDRAVGAPGARSSGPATLCGVAPKEPDP